MQLLDLGWIWTILAGNLCQHSYVDSSLPWNEMKLILKFRKLMLLSWEFEKNPSHSVVSTCSKKVEICALSKQLCLSKLAGGMPSSWAEPVHVRLILFSWSRSLWSCFFWMGRFRYFFTNPGQLNFSECLNCLDCMGRLNFKMLQMNNFYIGVWNWVAFANRLLIYPSNSAWSKLYQNYILVPHCLGLLSKVVNKSSILHERLKIDCPCSSVRGNFLATRIGQKPSNPTSYMLWSFSFSS